MKYSFAICYLLFAICTVADAAPAPRATVSRGQSVVQAGTNVRAKVAPSGLYSQECYDAFYGCMDQFCVPDNANGGSCTCSDENEAFEKKLADIEKLLIDAENIRTIEVERIQAGGNEDIIFGGSREYDEKGNIISSLSKTTPVDTKEKRRQELTAMFNSSWYDEDIFGE